MIYGREDEQNNDFKGKQRTHRIWSNRRRTDGKHGLKTERRWLDKDYRDRQLQD